ncbi:MAG: DUF2797 domain-containing protein [Methanomassiliicoccales archaeon]|jgi:hypothetical protein
MFVRADHLLFSYNPESYPQHAISFGWDEYKPHLEAFDIRTGKLMDIDLDEIDWHISEERRCVGRYNSDGYLPCPNKRKVERFDQCNSCASVWIGHQECIFEPRCNGTECDSEICRRKHVVYAAFHGDMIKIGMTSSSRLKERGIEQGADAIAPIVDCDNRMEARAAENQISRLLKARQTVSKNESLRTILRATDRGMYESRYEGVLAQVSKVLPIKNAPLEVLDRYPVAFTGKGHIEVTTLEGRHAGEVVAIKGKFLVYRSKTGKELKALQLSNVPSHFIRTQATQ